jgi:serine protease Do
MTTVLEELGTAVRTVRDALSAAVVGVGREGSGVVIASGLVATNAHNLRGGGLTVTFADGRSAEAEPAGVDVDGDLAVLRVDTGAVAAPAWGEAEAQVGDVVFGLANPGGRGVRVTFGTVSAVGQPFRGPRGRRVPASIEHTAPLPRGASGGPVVDGAGRVVGINTHRLAESFYLALPAGADLRTRLEALGRGESRSRARLGVALAPPSATRRLREAAGLTDVTGLLVRGVEEDGPAAGAGLRRGDVLVQAGDRNLASVDDVHDAMESAGPSLVLRIVRGVEELSVTVSLAGGTAS